MKKFVLNLDEIELNNFKEILNNNQNVSSMEILKQIEEQELMINFSKIFDKNFFMWIFCWGIGTYLVLDSLGFYNQNFSFLELFSKLFFFQGGMLLIIRAIKNL